MNPDFRPLEVAQPDTTCVFAIRYTLCNGSEVVKHFTAENMVQALIAFKTNPHTAGYLPDAVKFVTKVYV